MIEEIRQIVDKADDCLESAVYNMKGGFYDAAVNRSYYAIFDATVALLHAIGVTAKSHKGVQIKFNECFILTQILPESANQILASSFSKRQMGDYDLWSEITEEEAKKVVEDAAEFIELTKSYLSKNNFKL